MGNSNTELLAYTALVRPILEYGAVCWDHNKEGHVGALERLQKGAAKFANTDETGRETSVERSMVARLCALYMAYTRGRAWKAIGHRRSRPSYLSRVHHNRKIGLESKEQIIGKYSFINRTITNWNKLPADLLESFLCNLKNFRKWVKKVVTNK
jgi:hypothetical protein